MKYAVPVSGGVLSPHFGHCEQFALIDVDEERKVVGIAYNKKGNAFDALVNETKQIEGKKGKKKC